MFAGELVYRRSSAAIEERQPSGSPYWPPHRSTREKHAIHSLPLISSILEHGILAKCRNEEANAMTALSPEGRASLRKRTLLGGKIIFNGGHSVFDCTVRNLSDTGAMIQIENPLAVPNTFSLRFPDDRLLACEVRWRKINSIGVEFV
ncbi:PilZ domain-containing protein [Rhizobium sp. CNPSo 3968]|uniref:PilZ domain-containing protein n=1 Tax=Rhizobium sp. CNPSo 3968 TaxID=3021408 RepID=UPI00254E0003|nr:PilZ domain-containing protein [Rhizobium sp. CNPSo 3968]MDK4722445.1 PilZ domain-containing protein [Rhizobium sp. CNPSo 3968]